MKTSRSPSARVLPFLFGKGAKLHASTGMTSRRLIRDRWNSFWFRTCPPHLLAIFRIVFGAFLLFYLGIQLPHVGMFYSREGLHMPLYALPVFVPPSPAVAYALFTAFLLAIAFFTAGIFTRVTGWIAFLLYCYYWILTLFQFGTSFDRLFMFTLLTLSCSGCGKTFSFDARRKHGSWTAWEPISILPQRLLAMQITMTYLGVGWQKLMLPAWQTGKVLSVGFMGRWATSPAWAIARMNIPLPYYDALNWVIKAFEITIPFGLWMPRYRKWFFLGGALFHIVIAILLAIWWFVALIPAYILFLDPQQVYDTLSRGRGDKSVR